MLVQRNADLAAGLGFDEEALFPSSDGNGLGMAQRQQRQGWVQSGRLRISPLRRADILRHIHQG
jgi:hypothetical protein